MNCVQFNRNRMKNRNGNEHTHGTRPRGKSDMVGGAEKTLSPTALFTLWFYVVIVADIYNECGSKLEFFTGNV